MLFKNTFEQHPALRFVFDKLQFHSRMGHQAMLNSPVILEKDELERRIGELARIETLMKDSEQRKLLMKAAHNIHLVNDIAPALKALSDGNVMDDIQLFEIKKAAIYMRNVADNISLLPMEWLKFHDMRGVISILDPEHTGIPHFYVYSVYDDALHAVRGEIERCADPTERERLRFEEKEIEERVRSVLSDKLRPYAGELLENLRKIAGLDILLAKAKYAVDNSCCRPSVSSSHSFSGLTNPMVADQLSRNGRQFQPLNVSFGNETVLVTGANMGGKSVLLQTLAMAQYLFQFAFFLPAEQASLAIVDEVACSFGDRQSALSGLSSFAVEILTVDKIVRAAKEGRRVLALVDELARTTNPEEGRLLVAGFLKVCMRLSITAVVTTHYGGVDVPCRKLRVKGLVIPPGTTQLNARHIADLMDYSIIETDDTDVPREALTIARLLDVDGDYLDECVE